MVKSDRNLTFESLGKAYTEGSARPEEVVREVHARIEDGRSKSQNAWLWVREVDALVDDARALMARRASGEHLPLFGLPFAVKDNIDVAGLPTTVACPALEHVPSESNPVVERLVQAGAIVIGKSNMDQLAMGLVGVRSPYGIPVNPFDPTMIPGGSSSGSAVAVATGQVSFALATDTAGSGRVPAGFNNVVGLKPTRGALSTRGVAPACRSIDCVTVLAMTVSDACAVAEIGKGWDVEDPYSRPDAGDLLFAPAPGPWPRRLAVPRALEFFGDAQTEAIFRAALDRLRGMGCSIVEIDFTPFLRAGELLYGGPWVAERLVAGGALLAERPHELLPVVRAILAEAGTYDAVATFAGMYRLAALRQAVREVWSTADALVVPTAPTIYRIDQVLADPRLLNGNLGIYTTFANLLDLAGVAVPAGFRPDGLPAGITFLGPAGSDARLAALGAEHHRRLGGRLGATAYVVPAGHAEGYESPPDPEPPTPLRAERLKVAVVGAHLSGQPLNPQLTDAGGTLVRAAKTATHYRLFALPGTTPPKPGLLRAAHHGHAIDLEVWELDPAEFGRFVARVQAPLCIGSIELEDGSWVHGFLCEAHAVVGAEDISEWGGWRAYCLDRADRDAREGRHAR
jgi:allophanate hydrolase